MHRDTAQSDTVRRVWPALRRLLAAIIVTTAVGGLLACSDSSLPKQTVTLETGSEWLAQALAQHLRQQRIWFRQPDNTRFELSDPVPPAVTQYLQQRLDEALPQGRSMVVSPQIRAEVHAGMRSEGIAYHTVVFNGREWIVWDQPDDSERVKHIVATVVSDQLDC